MEENINIFALVLDELDKNDMWFTTKADPTAEEASSYYKLDEYGEPTEATVKKIEKEVTSLIGDGAVDEYDAVKLWVNDALVDFKIDYKDNLVTQFEDKPIVDNIEAYENPVQFPQSKKTESRKIIEGVLKNIQLEDEIDEWKVYSADVDTKLGKNIIATFKNYENDEGNVITNIRIDYNTSNNKYIVNYVDNDGRFHQIDYKLSDDELSQIAGSKKVEAKTKKTEGAGAGYEIRGSIDNAFVNSVDIENIERDEYGERVITISCDVDVELNDLVFESYYYGGNIDFPVKAKVVGLTMIDNDTYETEDEEPKINAFNVQDALNGTKFKEMLGGGWSHLPFTGEFSASAEGNQYSSYFYTDNVNIVIPNKTIVDFIDKKVDGVEDECTYEVFDKDSDLLDDFDDEDKAIEYAKKNNGVQVVQIWHNWKLTDEEGSVDDVDPEYDIVWERDYDKNYKFDDEVEESKEVKTETYKPTEDEKVGKMKDTNGTFFDVYQHGDKFLDVLGNELSKEEVAEYVKKYNKTEAKELKFKVNDIVEDKTGVGKIMEIDLEHPEGLIYGVQFSNVDLPNDKDDIGLWWCKEGDISLVTDKAKIDKYNKWFNTEYNKLESKKAERKKKQIEAFKNRKVNFNKCTKEENYQRRLDEVNNKSKNLISDMFSSNDFDSDSPAGQIVMRTSEMFNALSDKGYDVEVTFDNGESTSAIQLGQQGGKVMITITNTNQPLRAFTSGNFEINDQNIKILQDIQSQIEVL